MQLHSKNSCTYIDDVMVGCFCKLPFVTLFQLPKERDRSINSYSQESKTSLTVPVRSKFYVSTSVVMGSAFSLRLTLVRLNPTDHVPSGHRFIALKLSHALTISYAKLKGWMEMKLLLTLSNIP